MNPVLPLLNLSLISWVAWRVYQKQPLDRKFIYWPALSVKILAGIALGLLYFYHYRSGDTISYWQDGVTLANYFYGSPAAGLSFLSDETSVPVILNGLEQQTPRSLFFVKISGVLAIISGENYWMMATWLSVISFAAAWHLVIRVATLLPDLRKAAVIAVLFFPSVVFWSSGLIKESLGLASLYVLAAGGLGVIYRRRLSLTEVAWMVVALWFGWNLKYYWIGILVPVLVPLLVVQGIVALRPAWARFDWLVWVVLFAGFLIIATNLHPNFYASRFLEVIYHNNLDFTRLSDPPRLVQYLDLEDSPGSVLRNAPAALIAGLFRPFVWESFNGLSLAASLENLVLLVLVLQALPSLRRLPRSSSRVLMISMIVYVVLLVCFLALSTPNFGTLSRYRIGALPALVILCLNPFTALGRRLAQTKGLGEG